MRRRLRTEDSESPRATSTAPCRRRTQPRPGTTGGTRPAFGGSWDARRPNTTGVVFGINPIGTNPYAYVGRRVRGSHPRGRGEPPRPRCVAGWDPPPRHPIAPARDPAPARRRGRPLRVPRGGGGPPGSRRDAVHEARGDARRGRHPSPRRGRPRGRSAGPRRTRHAAYGAAGASRGSTSSARRREIGGGKRRTSSRFPPGRRFSAARAGGWHPERARAGRVSGPRRCSARGLSRVRRGRRRS